MPQSSRTPSPDISCNVTCPFCGILCDDLVIENSGGRLKVLKNGCPKAVTAFEKRLAASNPRIKGKVVSLDEAIIEAARLLEESRTPLITGLGCDVAGMRQVMRLADKTSAIVDHMRGDVLIRNMLVLQDLGWITTSLGEIKNRADMVIFAGTDASSHPRFFERIIWHEKALFLRKNVEREIVYIGDRLDTKPGVSPKGKRPLLINCKTDQIGEIVSTLHAIITGASIDAAEVAGIKTQTLEKLAEKMKQARYGVIVWSAADLDIPHAELTIQNFCETVKYLTRITRFAGFSLDGDNGTTTAANVCAWQSGYPLRVNFNKGYPDYDAHRYSTRHVLKSKEADALVWISSFGVASSLPLPKIPIIVLATPDTRLDFEPDVFIPVATPGVDHAGQLFRTDGVVALPLKQLRRSCFLGVHTILQQLITRLGE